MHQIRRRKWTFRGTNRELEVARRNFGKQETVGAHQAGARFRPNLNLRHPGFILFLKLSVPIMLALSLVFTDDWVIRWFGSYLQPSSITWLSYGKTLMRVPLGVVGQGVGVASFPFLAQLYSEGKMDELNRLLNTTMKWLIILLVPISALTIAESSPVVYLVFSHTRLRGTDFNATAATLLLFSLGMFAWGAQNILARGFYATRNTLTPAIVGTVLAVANLPVYWLLVRHFQHIGLALASSLGITAYVADSKAQALQEYGPPILYFNRTLFSHGNFTETDALRQSGYSTSGTFFWPAVFDLFRFSRPRLQSTSPGCRSEMSTWVIPQFRASRISTRT